MLVAGFRCELVPDMYNVLVAMQKGASVRLSILHIIASTHHWNAVPGTCKHECFRPDCDS